MLLKIALGNVRKSVRDFSVFFLTLAFGVCVFYSFGSITDQAAVLGMREDQRAAVETLVMMLDWISVFVVVILGFLVIYANRFLIRRRKHEFGVYLTLGMTTRQVSTIVVLETLAVGVAALAFGLLLGVFASQFMMYLTAQLFEASIVGFELVFSPSSCLSTIACFAGIFLVTMVFNVATVSHYKLIDLINARHASERVVLRSLPVSVALFIVSCAIIGYAYWTLTTYGMLQQNNRFWLATALVTVGTLLFFFSISGFLLKLLQSRDSIYLRGLNMFSLRQLNSRINTAWLSIFMVCAMLFLAICGVCTGLSIAFGSNESLANGTRYDVSVFALMSHDADASKVGELEKIVRADVPTWDEDVSEYATLATLRPSDQTFIMSDLTEGVDLTGVNSLLNSEMTAYSVGVPFVRLSDYNALRELLGEEPIELAADEALLWSGGASAYNDILERVREGRSGVSALGRTFVWADLPIAHEPAANSSVGGGLGMALVVSDEVVDSASMYVTQVSINAMLNDSSDAGQESFASKLGEYAYLEDNYEDTSVSLWGYNTARLIRIDASGTTAAVTYLAIYIGFVLLISAASVLALQQLSEAADNQERYRVLMELGAEPAMVCQALKVQVGVYFLFPLLVAVAHAGVALSVVNEAVLLLTGFNISGALVATVVFVLVLYGGYFAVTYLTSKGFLLRPQTR